MKNDPVMMFAKYKGYCDRCGHRINKGDQMYYYPITKHCVCGRNDYNQSMLLVQDDDAYQRMYGNY